MKSPDLPHPATQRDTHLTWWMILLLAILALILLSAGPAAQAVTSPCPTARLLPSSATDDALFGRAVSISDETVAIGALLDQGDDGAVYVFDRWQGKWIETAMLTHPGSDELMGIGVSILGDTLLASTVADVTYVYQRDDGGTPVNPEDDTWVEVDVLATPGGGNDVPTAISPTAAVVGTPGAQVVHVFKREGGGPWVPHQALSASPPSSPVDFGVSVAVAPTGDVIAVGDPRDDGFGPDVGAVHVYLRYDGGDPDDPFDDFWFPSQVLWPYSLEIVSKGFGTSVAVRNDMVIVGAPEVDAAVYVFARNDAGTPADPFDDTWDWPTTLAPAYTRIGYGLALDGDRLLVQGDDLMGPSAIPCAHVFEAVGAEWLEVGRMRPFEALDLSPSMGLSGRYALLGSELDGSPSGTSGKAWLFDLLVPSPWSDLGQGLPSEEWHVTPRMGAQGTLLDRDVVLTQSELPPYANAWLIIGFSPLYAPFKGGVLVPQPDLVAPWGTPLLGGEDALPLHWPIELPPGNELYFQYWILSQDWTLDATDPAHWSATNAILATQP